MRNHPLLVTLLASGLSACASTPAPAPTAPAASPSTAHAAVVHLTGASGSLVSGTLSVVPIQGGVRVRGDIGGLAPGPHGFHVHQTGDCSAADAASAGGHFNPTAQAHGRAAATPHHAGDIDNIAADAAGIAHVDTRLHGVSLGGGASNDIAGRAIVVHADPDDYRTQPSGNSGARIACGVIVARP